MRKILCISLPEIEAEYVVYLACYYNMTISEYIRSVLREKWQKDEFKACKLYIKELEKKLEI